MVNYRRLVFEVAALAVVAAVVSAAPAPECTHAHTHYDQRQNGSENYRLNIDGVVIAVAPAEELMSALGDMDDLFDLALEEYNQDFPSKPPSSTVLGGEKPQKPEKPQDVNPEKPQAQEEKPTDEKPAEGKPQEDKPEEVKPEAPLSDVSLSSDVKSHVKNASVRKHEKAQRLKNRLASFLVPLLRKNRQQ